MDVLGDAVGEECRWPWGGRQVAAAQDVRMLVFGNGVLGRTVAVVVGSKVWRGGGC